MNDKITWLYVSAAALAAFLLPSLIAYAAPAVPLPDPTVDATGFAAAIRDAFASGSYVLGLIAALWGLSRVLWSLRDRVAFLQSSKARAAVTGATGILAAVVTSLLAGGFDLAAVLGAVAVAVGLYMTPEPKAKPA
jgi:hypothetical protein